MMGPRSGVHATALPPHLLAVPCYFWKRRKLIADHLNLRGRGRAGFNPLSLANHPSRPTLGPDLMPDGGPLRHAAENRPWELLNVLNWSEGRERGVGPREAWAVSECAQHVL